MKKIALLLSLFVLLIFSSEAEAKKQRINVGQVASQFNNVVFFTEYSKRKADGSRTNTRTPKALNKWVKPVRVVFKGTFTRKQINDVNAVIKQVRKLTKIDVRMARKGEKANFWVELGSQKQLAGKLKKDLSSPINCRGDLTYDGKTKAITSARVLIPNDRPEKTSHCIVEEIVQIFGLLNDSPIIQDSIFFEGSKRTSMSLTDQILLKALYDPRLRPGMTRKEAAPIVPRVILDILQKASKKKKSQ